MKKLIIFAGLITALGFAQNLKAQLTVLQPLNTFGPNGDGSLRPDQPDSSGVTNFTSSGTAQRSLAYNPTTGHLLFVSRTNYTSVGSGTPPSGTQIYILDAATGTNLISSIDTNTVPLPTTNVFQLDIGSNFAGGGNVSFPYDMLGVADDGAIYAANLSSASSPPQFRLYRWANETAAQELVYFGDPGTGDNNTANRRWGDTFAIRGAGTDTQILIASRGSLAAILRPTDASMSTFSATTLHTDVNTVEGMGYGLTFGAGNTFWAKGASANGLPLLRLSFDLNAGTATTLQTYPLSLFPGRIGPINALLASNLLVGIEGVSITTDLVRLYDISNISNLTFLDRKLFTTNINNNIFAGAVAFGTNGTIYALNTDNGIVAYKLGSVAVNNLAPAIFLQPTNITIFPNSNVVFAAAADGSAPLTYQWQSNGTNIPNATATSITLTNVQLTDTGKTLDVIVTNNFGAVTSAIAVLVVSTNVPVTLPYYEAFNFPAGPLGTNGGWMLTSAANTTGTIEAGNLDIPGSRPSTGNRYSWGSANGNSQRLPFGIYNSGTLFFSMAIRVDALGSLSTSTAGTVGGFADGLTTLFGKLSILANGTGGYKLGTSIRAAPAVYAANDFNVGDTVFVVGRYTFNPGLNDDVMDIWINPATSTFEADSAPSGLIAASVTATGGDLTSIDRFFFRGVTTSIPQKIVADELRLGVTWASVTPLPQPSLNISHTINKVSIAWPTNATGYILQGTPSLNSPITWADVTNVPAITGTNKTVTLNNTSGTRFFRLSK